MTMPKHLQEMQGRMDSIKKRQEQAMSGSFGKRIDLTGKNAVVAQGGQAEIRILPRWDFMNAWVLQKGSWVKNPAYVEGAIFLPVLEHWFTTAEDKRARIWCPKTFGEQEPCALCEASEILKTSPSDDDREVGYDCDAKEIFLFNAILGRFGYRSMTDDGKPDIRYLPAGSGVFMGIGQLMTGSGNESFAKEVHDPVNGYDLQLIRPAGGRGDRWSVGCANDRTPLYDSRNAKEASVFNGWPTLMIDLPELVRKELKPYDEVYKMWHGSGTDTAPDAGGGGYPPGVAPPVAGPSAPGYAHPQYPGAAPAGGDPPMTEAGSEQWAQEFTMPPEQAGGSPPTPAQPPPSAPSRSPRGGRPGGRGRGRR